MDERDLMPIWEIRYGTEVIDSLQGTQVEAWMLCVDWQNRGFIDCYPVNTEDIKQTWVDVYRITKALSEPFDINNTSVIKSCYSRLEADAVLMDIRSNDPSGYYFIDSGVEYR